MVESGNLQINVYGDIHSSARQQVRENDILIMITFNRQPQILKTLDKATHEKMHKARFHTLPTGVEF